MPPQRLRKSVVRRKLDSQLAFFLRVREILAGTSSVGASACSTCRSPQQSLRLLNGETVGPAPSAPCGATSFRSLLKDPFAPVGPEPPYRNLRLEHAMAMSEKLMEPEKRATSSAPEKQKTEADCLAVPGTANSIRNICMRHWNTQQPGGQGLAADFDTYFKALSKEEREPFKRETFVSRGAARKTARLAGKQTGDASTNK